MAEKQAAEKEVRLTGNQLMQMAEQEKRRLEEINRKLETFRTFTQELRGAKDALEELSKSSKGEQILVHLGAGIYVKAGVEDKDRAITSMTGNTFKEKKFSELAETLGNKLKNMEKTLDNTAKEQQKVIGQIAQIEHILRAGQAYMQQQKKQQ